MTANSQDQLRDVTWAEILLWARKLPPELFSLYEWGVERIFLRQEPEACFAAARTAGKDRPESLQGFHSENSLVIVEEASGIDDGLFPIMLGALSTAGSKMVMAGNPTRANGYFYDAFTLLRESWHTMRVSSEDVPRAHDHIADIVARFGRDGNDYRVRVLGEFPTTADEQVIPLEWIEAAVARRVEPSELYRVVWGVDVARFGDDRSALAKRRGNVLLAPVRSWRGKDTMQTAGIIRREYEDAFEDERPAEILVDVIGIGAGVVDKLLEDGIPARGVNVGEQAAATDKFARQRDELWWRCREWFAKRDCGMPDDPELIAELTSPLYSFTSAGKTLVESKDDQKKRLGRSPDLADAFVLTMAGGLDRIDERREDRYSRRRRPLYGGVSWMSG